MNEGCIPTKAMLRSAEVMQLVAREASQFGVHVQGEVTFNLREAVARKDRIVQGVVDCIYNSLQENEGVTFLKGHATFVSDHEVEVDGQRYIADKFIIATGAQAGRPDIPGLAEAGYITNREALFLEELPSSLLVIGGGYVGIEFAQMYGRFGTRVTVLQRNVQILPGEERELADMLAGYLGEEGIEIHTGSPVVRVEKEGTEKVVVARINGQERRFKGSEILLAAGRHPRTAELSLENVGVETNGPAIVVDEQLRTSAPHVWAIGDVTGGYMYTHVATYEGPYAALNAVRDLGRKADHRVVPRAVFTSPALASVGLTEDDARAEGHEVKTGIFPFAWSGKAKAIGDTRGKIKVVVNAENDEILGFHILGPDGDNLIHEAVVAMYDHGTVEPITKSIHIHPTLAEAVKSAAKGVG